MCLGACFTGHLSSLIAKRCISTTEARPGISEYVCVNTSRFCFKNLLYASLFWGHVSIDEGRLFPHWNQGWPPVARLGWLALSPQIQEVPLSPRSSSSSFLATWEHLICNRYPNHFRSLGKTSPMERDLICSRFSIASKGGIFPRFCSLRGYARLPGTLSWFSVRTVRMQLHGSLLVLSSVWVLAWLSMLPEAWKMIGCLGFPHRSDNRCRSSPTELALLNSTRGNLGIIGISSSSTTHFILSWSLFVL